MRYNTNMFKYLIFDVDQTLLKFDEDEKRAFSLTFADYGVCLTEEQLCRFRDFSYEEWARLGLDDVHTEYIQKNFHSIYRTYVSEMLRNLLSTLRLERDLEEITEKFYSYLSLSGHAMEGAEAVLQRLKGKYIVCIATNGLHRVQKERISCFSGLFDRAFVSEQVGYIKPEKAFFDCVLKELNARAEDCLMIGDSLASDVAGANGCGIKSCWFNPLRLPRGEMIPDYEINEWEELFSVLE